MPRTPRRGRTRRGTVVKSRSRDPLQGFTFSPRSTRRDAQLYDMGSDGLTARRTPPRRRRRTRVKTPESDPFDFGDEAFSPVNSRRQGIYIGSKKKKKKSKGKKKKGSKKKGNKRKSMRKTRKYLGGSVTGVFDTETDPLDAIEAINNEIYINNYLQRLVNGEIDIEQYLEDTKYVPGSEGERLRQELASSTTADDRARAERFAVSEVTRRIAHLRANPEAFRRNVEDFRRTLLALRRNAQDIIRQRDALAAQSR